MCACVFMHACVCVRVCELLSWWETGREGMCMVGLQPNRWGPFLNQGHLTTTTVTVRTESCRNNQCHPDGVWIPFAFRHHDTCIVTLGAVVELLAHGVREDENITAAWTKGPWRDARGRAQKSVSMCMCQLVTLRFTTVELLLDSLSILHFWIMEASIWDSWDSDSRLLFAAYGKSPYLPGSLPKTACCAIWSVMGLDFPLIYIISSVESSLYWDK